MMPHASRDPKSPSSYGKTKINKLQSTHQQTVDREHSSPHPPSGPLGPPIIKSGPNPGND